MKPEQFSEAMNELPNKYIEEAARYRKPKRWALWVDLAACLCLAAALVLIFSPPRTPEDPVAEAPSEGGPPYVMVGGRRFIESSWMSPEIVSREIPEGFSPAGTLTEGEFSGHEYYVNVEVPEWIYVRTEVRTDGLLDEHGTVIRSEPHEAYLRFVDARLRGRHLVCRDDTLYIDLWSAGTGDLSAETYDRVEKQYGVRIEGALPAGFASLGTAPFTGYDTIPEGALGCNIRKTEVLGSEAEPEILLIPTEWYTAPDGSGEILHTGFDVYVRLEREMDFS